MRWIFVIVIALALSGCNYGPKQTTDSGVRDVPAAVREITPEEAQVQVSRAYSQFIDVRTPDEYAGGHAARAVNIPLDTLDQNIDRIEKNEQVYFICETGNRSMKAAEKLKAAGFNNVLSVAGGTAAWKEAGLPIETAPPHGGS